MWDGIAQRTIAPGASIIFHCAGADCRCAEFARALALLVTRFEVARFVCEDSELPLRVKIADTKVASKNGAAKVFGTVQANLLDRVRHVVASLQAA